jgi:uncharacterized protein (TIGR02246 family)
MITRTISIGASILALALVGACKPPVDTAKEADAVRAVETQWVADLKTHDAAKFAAYYDAQGTSIGPGAAPATGADAIKAAMQPLFSDPNFSLVFAPDTVGVASAGDIAYTQGHFTMTLTDPATHAKTTQTGSYVTVYKKEPDGSWKAVEDIASPGAPPPAATKAG